MFFVSFSDSIGQMQHNVNPSSAGCLSAFVAAEHRRLFGHGRNVKRPRPSSFLPKSKQSASCTLKFVFLASTEEAARPPMSVKERTVLAMLAWVTLVSPLGLTRALSIMELYSDFLS